MQRKRSKKNIRTRKVNIYNADFDKFVLDENYYDKTFTINTIYFWENPDFSISKIFGLLKPDRTLILGFHIKKHDLAFKTVKNLRMSEDEQKAIKNEFVVLSE